MDMAPFKRWCFLNVILPGALLVDGDNTTDPCVMCHDAAVTPPGYRVLRFMEDNWLLVLVVTLSIVIAVGVVLFVHHMRWKRALQLQLEMGNIDRNQYERLR
jgi:hypothetical protein